MGRTNEVVKEKLQYRKIGGGSARLRLEGRRKIIKPSERFWAYPEDIPEAFKDTIVLLDGQTAPKAEAPVTVDKIFKVAVRPKTAGDADPGKTKKGKKRKWYNVINKDTKKVMNPEPLTETKAKKLADSLNAV